MGSKSPSHDVDPHVDLPLAHDPRQDLFELVPADPVHQCDGLVARGRTGVLHVYLFQHRSHLFEHLSAVFGCLSFHLFVLGRAVERSKGKRQENNNGQNP